MTAVADVIRFSYRTFFPLGAFWLMERAGAKMELDELLLRCRGGDSLAWESFVYLYQGRVFGLALHYLGNPDDARDAAQEVFIKTYRKLRRCPGAEQLVPWLLTITRNTCLDHLRRRRARPQAVDLSDVNFVHDQDDSPEERLLSKSKRSLFYRALGRLTRLSREIILLKEIQGLSLEEISSLLNIPLGTVKSRSHRARIELAESYVATTGYSADGVKR